MSEARAEIWSLPDFLAWESHQERRWELVEGRATMMAGGTQAHALIAANLIVALRPLLRASSCRPVGSDLRIPIPATGNVRYPDVTIDCGRFDPSAHDASEPRIVFEVLSQSTGWYDQTRKLRDYEGVPTIRQYVCISQSEPRVSVWLRSEDGRFAQQDDILAGELSLNIEGGPISLALTDVYEGTDLLPASRTA
ncbi:Uma2 family endonuclease [Aureimonas pseudogalii]|uniref:Uma2 family endonuclease n=1 Tax=Aureimonas pseudogalii TaxID=1744844 RepID=A0A7W6EA97_9HYPH|nr:Uma2 family endonuclease [Aureimonas pseudogalii]MBB3996326.1 Uma2 family endonuclease [Aureimonas pseudogalii]